jgi:hypothetical protein
MPWQPDSAVTDWLRDSDPALRWQVLQDLLDAPADEVAAERAKVATEGWGAALLAQQQADGSWGGQAWDPAYSSTTHALALLREMGLDPASPQARQAVGRVRDGVIWAGWEEELGDVRYFGGEVEPCINGQVALGGAYFGQDVSRITQRLLREQLADGGWNCEAERGSLRSSFNSTICVIEALLEIERAGGADPAVHAARRRGEEYLLERRLMRRKSTGEVIQCDRMSGEQWTQFAFPAWWRYDVLRALDYFRWAGTAPDERVAEAIDIVQAKRTADGRWLLDTQHDGAMQTLFGETVGAPSRWNTLRVLRVLRWHSRQD